MRKILLLLAVIVAATACKQDNPNTCNSIFDTGSPERNSFDKWLMQNYTIPYNIKVYYLMKDIETDYYYNVVPADIHKSKQLSKMMKFMWLEPYEKVAKNGIHFVRSTVPPVFHYIGSSQHQSNGTIILGTASGGVMITMMDINNFDPKSEEYVLEVLSTIHHEFAHILHQRMPYTEEFQKLSAADYDASGWQDRDELTAARLGFVTPYAGKASEEDFVEQIARYLSWSDEKWEQTLRYAGSEGRELILKKHDMVMSYMRMTWGIDLDELKAEIQRRLLDLQSMDFENLGF